MPSIHGGGSREFGFDDVDEKLSPKLQQAEEDLHAAFDDADATSMTSMLGVQKKMSEMTMFYGLTSGTVKSLKDATQSVMNKISN